MGGEEVSWGKVADAILSWQIVQIMQNRGSVTNSAASSRIFESKSAISLEDIGRKLGLKGGEVTPRHIAAANAIFDTRGLGKNPGGTLDWYWLLYRALQNHNIMQKRNGKGETAFARLCFELHNTVNKMLRPEEELAFKTFEELESKYSSFKKVVKGVGGVTWYTNICMTVR